MPRGGARVGAGRKPKEKRALTLVNSRRDPTPAPPRPPADVDDELALPPTDLTPAERDVWRAWAPLALEAQTLTPATAVGFRELCTVAVLTHAIAESIELARAPGKKNEPRAAIGDALKIYTKYAQRLDGLLARFKLTAFGKPVDGAAKPTAAVNPWAEVAKR